MVDVYLELSSERRIQPYYTSRVYPSNPVVYYTLFANTEKDHILRQMQQFFAISSTDISKAFQGQKSYSTTSSLAQLLNIKNSDEHIPAATIVKITALPFYQAQKALMTNQQTDEMNANHIPYNYKNLNEKQFNDLQVTKANDDSDEGTQFSLKRFEQDIFVYGHFQNESKSENKDQVRSDSTDQNKNLQGGSSTTQSSHGKHYIKSNKNQIFFNEFKNINTSIIKFMQIQVNMFQNSFVEQYLNKLQQLVFIISDEISQMQKLKELLNIIAAQSPYAKTLISFFKEIMKHLQILGSKALLQSKGKALLQLKKYLQLEQKRANDAAKLEQFDFYCQAQWQTHQDYAKFITNLRIHKQKQIDPFFLNLFQDLNRLQRQKTLQKKAIQKGKSPYMPEWQIYYQLTQKQDKIISRLFKEQLKNVKWFAQTVARDNQLSKQIKEIYQWKPKEKKQKRKHKEQLSNQTSMRSLNTTNYQFSVGSNNQGYTAKAFDKKRKEDRQFQLPANYKDIYLNIPLPTQQRPPSLQIQSSVHQNPHSIAEIDNKNESQQSLLQKLFSQSPLSTTQNLKRCVGIIQCCWLSRDNQIQQVCYGTAFAISPRIIVTCAHSIYDEKQRTTCDKVYFIPVNGKAGEKQIYETMDNNFMRFQQIRTGKIYGKQPLPEDVCVLVLKKQLNLHHYLQLAPIALQGQKDKISLQIWGYPGSEYQKNTPRTGTDFLRKDLQGQLKGLRSSSNSPKQFILIHTMLTSRGFSGSPIIYEDKVVAIHTHKGLTQNTGEGLLMTQQLYQQIMAYKDQLCKVHQISQTNKQDQEISQGSSPKKESGN